LSEEENNLLFNHMDKDGSGFLDTEELIRGLAKPLSKERIFWIKAAYDKLDVNRDGKVTLDDIAKLYDVNQHPDVQ
jgi:Ca2+-binding EF-hand superfamily protein